MRAQWSPFRIRKLTSLARRSRDWTEIGAALEVTASAARSAFYKYVQPSPSKTPDSIREQAAERRRRELKKHRAYDRARRDRHNAQRRARRARLA